MGKALLLIVLGGSVVLARQLYNTTENEARTSEHQTAYQEEVIAREIAASAFNVAMGEIRNHGEDLHTAVREFNGGSVASAGLGIDLPVALIGVGPLAAAIAPGGRSGTYGSGRFAGGSYETRAMLTSGHSVRVISTGRYGDAEFTMHDEYRVPVLIAREDGLVTISPNLSDPDVCSAIFYQAYPIGVDAANLPEPEMLFASSNLSRDGKRSLQSTFATAGTQMNFFIAIDDDCSMEIDTSVDQCADDREAATYTFNAADWDHIHYALDIDVADVDQAEEGAWAFVEQSAADRQSWRISWEDQHKWNAPAEQDPDKSLQALKSDGYDGDGWTLASGTAYVGIGDQGGGRPDFADQSISVRVISPDFGDPTSPNYSGKVTSFFAKQKRFIDAQSACGLEVDEYLVDPPLDIDTNGDGIVDIPLVPPTSAPETTAANEEVQDTITEDDLVDYACQCTSNGTKKNKTAVLHRPPGNEANEQLICIGTPAVDDHFREHNDIFPTCEAGSNIQTNNDRKR